MHLQECQDLGVAPILGAYPAWLCAPPPSRRAYDDTRPLRANHDEIREKLDLTNDTGFVLSWDLPTAVCTGHMASYNDEPTRLMITAMVYVGQTTNHNDEIRERTD